MKGMSSLHSSFTRGAETSCGKFWKRSQLCQCSKPLMLTAASGCKSCADGGATMLHVSELLLAAPTAAIHGNTLCPGPRAGDLDPRCSHPARLVVGGYDDSVLLKTLEGGVEVAMEAGGDHGGLGRGDILDLANLCRLILRRVVLESRLAVDSRGTLCSTQSSQLSQKSVPTHGRCSAPWWWRPGFSSSVQGACSARCRCRR